MIESLENPSRSEDLIRCQSGKKRMRYFQISSASPLPQWRLEEGLEVALTESLALQSTTTAMAWRSSPIHPLVASAPAPDLGRGVWYISFLVPIDAFKTLGKIAKRAFPGVETQTWFGLGLASVIIFSHLPESVNPVTEDLGEDLVAFEQWSVEDGKIIGGQLHKSPRPKNSAANPLPAVPLLSPCDLRGIIEEFNCSYRELHRWATLYAPAETERLACLLAEAATLVNELLWLEAKSGPVPEGLTDFDTNNALMRSKLTQQRIDRIVQINAALSYVISQGFFGSPPILSDTCMVRRHSLLGIGRAHRCLLNLVREVEVAFSALSVPASIYEKWAHMPGLSGFDSSTSIDSSGWSGRNLPDVLLTGPADPHPFKLVYFSGRLGYRESEYAISAAIHALTSGDSPDWHLSTMTHEILHGHVRDLLGTIFDVVKGDDAKDVGGFWEHVFLRFRTHMEGSCKDCTLIDSVRSVLLSYCCMTPYMGSLTVYPAERATQKSNGLRFGKIKVPETAPDLRKRLEEEERNISELLVHTLDLHYFYSDNFEAYSRAVWASWRTVPVVLRDARQYVLRILLSRTSLDGGSPIERFARARNQLRQSLERLNADLGPDPVWESAIRLLELEALPNLDERTNEASHPLFQPFFAGIRVVDLARQCFASGLVRERLFHNDVIRALDDDSDIDFEFTPGEFSDREVRSIAEFTAWRARSEDPREMGNGVIERRTAWHFLACGRIA